LSDAADEAEDDFDADPQPIPSAGRTLGGGSAPPQAATQPGSSSSAPRAPQRGMRTLSDLRGDAEPHDHDHDDDSDQDLFTGGEKSGLAVHNPSNPQDQIQGLLDRARRLVCYIGSMYSSY
jgi:UBX domain-containing protein 1